MEAHTLHRGAWCLPMYSYVLLSLHYVIPHRFLQLLLQFLILLLELSTHMLLEHMRALYMYVPAAILDLSK